MMTRAKVIFAIVCGLLCGGVYFLQAIDWLVVRNAPVVAGRVVSREPTSWLSIPRVDFKIKIDGSEMLVHARTQRGMMNKVPGIVRFHYTGDPNRNVILFEQEMYPGWLVLFFWGAALFLALFMRLGYIGVRHHRAFMASSSEPLRLNEVGAYGDLAARPNPSGFVILTVPPFEQMIPFIAQRFGRELTPVEIEVERKKAPSIVLTKDAAEQMAAERARRG